MFNRIEILRSAWSDYRRDVKMGWGVRHGSPFSRQHFAYCLRMAWAAAKAVAARLAVVAAPVAATVSADPIRAAVIHTELRDMELASDFMNWQHRSALNAELARLSA